MTNRQKKLVGGLTIVELLIALAISVVLLTAVAVAFNASITNYQQNQDIFKTINTSRQALFRMTTHIRTATAVQTTEAPNQCSLVTADSQDITYRYNSTDNKLYLVTNDDGANYVLCDNVTAMTFTKDIDFDDEGGAFVKSVQISMTVESGRVSKTLCAAAVVRRNLQ